MTEPLKPCPWCKATPDMTDNLATDSGSKAQIGKWAWIECDCGARSPDVRANWGSLPDWQQDASDAWNCRAPVALPDREEVAAELHSWLFADRDEPANSEWEKLSESRQWAFLGAADAILNLMRERMG